MTMGWRSPFFLMSSARSRSSSSGISGNSSAAGCAGVEKTSLGIPIVRRYFGSANRSGSTRWSNTSLASLLLALLRGRPAAHVGAAGERLAGDAEGAGQLHHRLERRVAPPQAVLVDGGERDAAGLGEPGLAQLLLIPQLPEPLRERHNFLR